jgi:hypothetical protein
MKNKKKTIVLQYGAVRFSLNRGKYVNLKINLQKLSQYFTFENYGCKVLYFSRVFRTNRGDFVSNSKDMFCQSHQIFYYSPSEV